MAPSQFCKETEFAKPHCNTRNPDSKATRPEVAVIGHFPTKNALPATSFPLK